MSADDDDRCGDDRDYEQAWMEVYGPDRVRLMAALHDQALTAEALDAAVPLEGRWPDPRVLAQTAYWWMPDGERLDLARFGEADAAWLLRWLRGLAPRLHRRAALDEALTTPSAVLTAMDAAGVPRVERVDPASWVAATPLARRLAALGGPA